MSLQCFRFLNVKEPNADSAIVMAHHLAVELAENNFGADRRTGFGREVRAR